jgi:hypothetical protein
MKPTSRSRLLLTQVPALFALQLLAFFVAGIALAGALMRIPVLLFNGQTLLYLLVGLAPIPFFPRNLTFRYLTYWITLAGVGGLMHLLGDRLGPLFGHPEHHGSGNILLQAVFFTLLLSIGLVMLQKVRRRNKPNAPD